MVLAMKGRAPLKAMFSHDEQRAFGPVAAQGVGVAGKPDPAAVAYAKERASRRALRQISGAISDHADVRRMLMSMRGADILRGPGHGRSIAPVAIDMAKRHGRRENGAGARRAFFDPRWPKVFLHRIAGVTVASEAIQVQWRQWALIEETGVAAVSPRCVASQRSTRATNGLQAMDLVARKARRRGRGRPAA